MADPTPDTETADAETAVPESNDAPPRPRRWLRWARELVLLLVVALVASEVVGWLRAPPLPDRPYHFTQQTLDGEVLDLDQFKGQWLVLNFWATWCGPCRAEIPSFSKFADNNPDIAILGVASDGSRGKLRHAARELGITYPVLLPDEAHDFAYDVTALPTTVFINPAGEVDRIHVGVLTRPQLWWMTR